MSNDRRKSIEAALHRYSSREAKKLAPKKQKKNAHPEKDVEKSCLEWMRAKNWNVQIYESKATFDPRRGVWRNQSMAAGNADCQGNLPDGVTIAVEFKAPGKLKNFNREGNERQVEFIYNKIQTNCFACVVDSAERLQLIYEVWDSRRKHSTELAKEYLLSMLP